MKSKLKKLDYPLLIAMLIFLIFGLIMIFSASNVSTVLRYDLPTTHFFRKQLTFIILSLLFGFIVLINFPTKKYKMIGYIYLIGWIAALLLLMIYGKVAGGALSWYNFGFANLQPTEFVKPALIIFFAVYYNRIYRLKKRPPLLLIIPFIVTAIVAVLVLIQPDFGGAVIICSLLFFIFLLLPDEKIKKMRLFKYILGGIAIFLLVLFYTNTKILDSYQLKRLEFRHPCERYIEDTGYQVCNGYIAIHNGGLLGNGLGNSTQKYLYLPEAHTDFIFPIIIEELGVLTGIIVIATYAFILLRIFMIARKATNIRNQILCYGCFIYLLIHILINLLGVLALMPLTGVPLPFLSYGGSYVVNVICMIFIVERVAIENNTIKKDK